MTAIALPVLEKTGCLLAALLIPPTRLSNEGWYKPDQSPLLASRIRDGQAKNYEMLQKNINWKLSV
jgi:hypothetical protein